MEDEQNFVAYGTQAKYLSLMVSNQHSIKVNIIFKTVQLKSKHDRNENYCKQIAKLNNKHKMRQT